MVYNLVAIFLSLIALGTSSLLAFRQTILQRQANHLPAYLSLLNEFRSREFNDHFRYVCDQLRQDHDPQLGISGLPPEAREAFYDVAYFLQNFVALRKLSIVDGRVLTTMNGRIVLVWDAIEPFVKSEREINRSTSDILFRVLEDFAMEVRDRPLESFTTILERRRRRNRQRLPNHVPAQEAAAVSAEVQQTQSAPVPD